MPYRFVTDPPRGVVWAVSIFWALAIVIFVGSSCYELYENHLYAVEGVQAQAQVEKKFKQAATTGRYKTAQLYLAYSYSVNGAAYHNDEISVTRSTWNDFNPHDSIPISYLRDEPEQSRVDLPVENKMSYWFPVVSLLLSVVFLIAGVSFALRKKPTPPIT